MMKQRISAFAVLAILGGWLQAAAVPGQPAPAFTARDIDGKAHTLGDYQGKILVLEAYNLDCPYCANHYKTGAMQELQAWAAGKGVVWLLVNSVHGGNPSHRTPAEAKKEVAEQKIKATAWIDDSSGAVGKAYGLKTTPHVVIVDAQGRVAYDGAIDNRPEASGDPRTARNYAREALEALLAGKAVSVKSQKPYGCSVKYGS
jgi:peroxiredoxin